MEIREQSVSIYSNLVKCDEIHIEENLKIKTHLSFDYNPKIEISGPSGIPGIPNSFNTFIKDSGNLLYTSNIHPGMFSSVLRRWVFDCDMEVRDESDNIISSFNLFKRFKTGKVLVSVDSSALGDTLSWIPYIEEFRKKYAVSNLIVTTFWNHLFEGRYPNIKFRHPGYREEEIDAVIGVGWYEETDTNVHKNDPRTIPMQQIASDILGVEYAGEIRPKINRTLLSRPTNKKYVCIATESTAGAKYWHYPGGWQRLVDLLKLIGYDVVVIHKQPTDLKGVIDRTGDLPMEDRISDLLQCEFFIGLGSGMSWLSWALEVPTVMISGFSLPTMEFLDKTLRIINKDVCHGCFSNASYKFDKGDWWWCPVHKGTDRYFECTRTIKPEDVFIKILDWIPTL